MFIARTTMGIVEPGWVADVLRFWFEELGEAHWFARRADLDACIRDRFLWLQERLAADPGFAGTTQRTLLAAIVVLDQFSRNIYRGTPSAFTTDPIARQFSGTTIARGSDVALGKPERLCLYLPFQHSESREDQALAVELISQLGNEEWTRTAEEHKAIIDRFGRFPHRNAILNRPSTAEELEVLQSRAAWW